MCHGDPPSSEDAVWKVFSGFVLGEASEGLHRA